MVIIYVLAVLYVNYDDGERREKNPCEQIFRKRKRELESRKMNGKIKHSEICVHIIFVAVFFLNKIHLPLLDDTHAI